MIQQVFYGGRQGSALDEQSEVNISKFYTSNQSEPQGTETCRHKSGYLLLLLAVSFHRYLMWATSYKELSRHPETSDMCSSSESPKTYATEHIDKWYKSSQYPPGELLSKAKPQLSTAKIACVRMWVGDAFLGANFEPRECWESGPFLLLNPPLKSNWILDESAEKETLSERGESGCLRKKTIKEWEAGDGTFLDELFFKGWRTMRCLTG